MRRTLARAACLLALASSACSTVQLHPTVFEKKRFALVSFAGERTISSRYLGTVGLVRISGNNWGAQVTADLLDETHRRLGEILGGELLPLERVSAAPGYASVPRMPGEDAFVSPRRLRALDLSEKNDAALGRLAAELGVDAVVGVVHEYTVIAKRETAQQYAQNEFRLVIVGADGRRLWDQREAPESAFAEPTPEQRSRESLGIVTDDIAGLLTKQAARAGLELFAARYGEKAGLHRTVAEKASP